MTSNKLHQDEKPVLYVTLRRAHGFYSGPADARRERRYLERKAAKAARKGKGGNHA